MIAFHGDTWDFCILQWLKGFNSASKGAGEDLAGVEQVAGNQDKIYLFGDGIRHNAAKHAKEVLVPFGFTGRGAVGFAEVDIGSVEKFDHMSKASEIITGSILCHLFIRIDVFVISIQV